MPIKKEIGQIIKGSLLLQGPEKEKKDKVKKKTAIELEKMKKKNQSIVLDASKIMLKGILPSTLKKKFGIEEADFYRFQMSLDACQEQWDEIQKQQKKYGRAQTVFHWYYAKDNILDFIRMLIRFLDEEPKDGMDPMVYAAKGYDNCLVYIRKMFQQLTESYEKCDLSSQASKNKKSTARLYMLRDISSDNRDISTLVYTLEKAEARRVKMKENQISDGELGLLSQEAERLKDLLKAEKVLEYIEYLDKKTEQLKSRVKRIRAETEDSEQLYQVLCSLMGSEENNRLMDELDPENGKLEGKNAEEIREKYRPLLVQLTEVAEQFPSKME